MILIFDIITNIKSEYSTVFTLSQLAWNEYNESGSLTSSNNYHIISENNNINYNEDTNERVDSIFKEKGVDIRYVLNKFINCVDSSEINISHNLDFKLNVISSELNRYSIKYPIKNKKSICLMKSLINYDNLIENILLKSSNQNKQYKEILNKEIINKKNAKLLVDITSEYFWKLVLGDFINLKKYYNVEWWKQIDEKTRSLLSNHFKFCYEGKCHDYKKNIIYYKDIFENFGQNLGSILNDNEIIPLNLDQIEKITYLNLNFVEKNIFKYLKFIKNLRFLEIANTKDIDLNNVSVLEKLEVLSINNCNIVKNNQLNSFQTLKKLLIGNISTTNFEYDEFYKIFPNVKELEIFEKGSNYIAKNWSVDQINFNDFSFIRLIENMPNLNHLIIHPKVDSKLIALSKSKNEIQHIECHYLDENISSISIINSFKKLKSLKCRFRHDSNNIEINENLIIEEIYFFSDHYDMNDYNFKDLSKLINLKKLELNGFKKINDYTFLKNLTGLTHLNLESSNFIETELLHSLASLEYLNLDYTQVNSLECLLLPNLKELHLRSTEIKDFNLIPNFQNLEILEISYDSVFDNYGKSIKFWELGVYLANLKKLTIESINFNPLLLDYIPNLEVFEWSDCPLDNSMIKSLYSKYPKIKFCISPVFY